jgi:hypothetical protein
VLTALLLALGIVLAGAPAANAYSWTGCKWSSTTVTYRNNGGGYAAQVTAAANLWSNLTDVSMSTNPGSTFNVFTQNDGNNGYAGYAYWSCGIFGQTQAADAHFNTYYSSYSAAQRMAVWVHEIGHGLGLEHAANIAYVMWTCPACHYNSTGRYVPESDDIAGIDDRY